jgi:hypothetical protein
MWVMVGVPVGLGLILLAAFLATRPSVSSADNLLTRTFDKSPTGFTFRYPDGWEYLIPMQGLLVLGDPTTLYDNVAGPTFTVQRNDPLSVYGSLDEALDLYLRRGPMRPDRSWSMLGDINKSTFEGREALIVDIQGKENEASPELRAHVVVTTSQNSFVYMLILTAPTENWSVHEPILTAMLDSLKLLE